MERLQACVTQAQQGHFFPFDEDLFSHPNTAKLDPDVIAGYHLANNAKYAELIDGAEGLHNCRLQAKESNRVVDEQSCPKCPPHFYTFLGARTILLRVLPLSQPNSQQEASGCRRLARRKQEVFEGSTTFGGVAEAPHAIWDGSIQLFPEQVLWR